MGPNPTPSEVEEGYSVQGGVGGEAGGGSGLQGWDSDIASLGDLFRGHRWEGSKWQIPSPLRGCPLVLIHVFLVLACAS